MFQKAQPIWIRGKTCEMNLYAVFQAEAELTAGAELHIAGTAFYRIYVNDCFAHFGPARTAKGYLRKDVIPLEPYLKPGDRRCRIRVEAMGYYCKSLSTVRQPSCIMAEIREKGQAVAYTGRDFQGFLPGCRLQKAERYSVQRAFTEVWDYRGNRGLAQASGSAEEVVVKEEFQILERHALCPQYEDFDLAKASLYGSFVFDETRQFQERRYSWKGELPHWGMFPWEEIPYHPYAWVQRQKQTVLGREKKLPLQLNEGEYAILDFGRIEAGFLKASMESLGESDIVIAFSEFYQGEEFQFCNMNAHNVLEYLLAEGNRYQVQSFEPYTFRFVMVAVKEGCIRLCSLGVKTFQYDLGGIPWPACENEVQASICRAAVRTFAHNAVDLYTDCPSRERAGWLCDSYFTGRTEYALTGKTLVEDNFLENYRLFENPGDYPAGVLPDCYPSDVRGGGEFIPQWTMWYILEVEEYLLKRGHEDRTEEFRKSIYGLLDFYVQYENEDGLLECLPSWNFVEWSKANEWTKDVNYPTNFLYARALEAVYHIYGDEECERRSRRVRKAAVEQSFNGRYFRDHGVRDEKGVLRVQEDSSEACQYYAVLFGGIDLRADAYQELKSLILHVFSPDRKGAMPQILEVNAFIGAYLRMDTLLKMQEYELVLKDAEGFFGKMEEYTGTLWEYRQLVGSYDHGFASYAFVVIAEAVGGGEKR